MNILLIERQEMKVQKLTEEQKEEIHKRSAIIKNILSQIDDLQAQSSIEQVQLETYINSLVPSKTYPRMSDCGEYLILVSALGGN